MSDLPSREEMLEDRPWIGADLEVLIVEAYVLNELKTEAEWREAVEVTE